MSLEKAKAHLRRWGKDRDVKEHELSSATVELAALALGAEPCRIAKTLAFLNGERTILLVAAGDARVDSSRFKKAFGVKKVKMVPPEDVERRTGHAVGGVCPFGAPPETDVFLDESLRRFRTVFPACGSSNSSVELTLPELEACSEARGWVDVCGGWK
ncbi:YbaK/EbsC family protein [Mailhella sp.]|uniref:YbaK/EbsC family protein n=1 Tax=Mailhella sp. TaxID=1981029 RepID=UPI003AB510DC